MGQGGVRETPSATLRCTLSGHSSLPYNQALTWFTPFLPNPLISPNEVFYTRLTVR